MSRGVAAGGVGSDPELVVGIGETGLGRRRHVRQRGASFCARDRKRLQLAAGDQRHRGCEGGEIEIEPLGHHLSEYLGCASERDVQTIEPRGQAKPLGSEMSGVAPASRTVGHGSGPGLCGSDKIVDGFVALCRRDYHHKRKICERGHPCQIVGHAERKVCHRRWDNREPRA